jgi:hypothetical protein
VARRHADGDTAPGIVWNEVARRAKGDGSREVAPGDFSRTQVGDDSDTSPYRAQGVIGISPSVYIRNMSELIRYLEGK